MVSNLIFMDMNNFSHECQILLICQICLRSQLSQQMNTKLRKSDAEYINARLVNLKVKFELTEFTHEAEQYQKFIIFEIPSSIRLLK